MVIATYDNYYIHDKNTLIIKLHYNGKLDDIDELNNSTNNLQIKYLYFTDSYDEYFIMNSFEFTDSFYQIKKLSYSKFNQPIDNLPQTLESLSFGFSFNCTIDNLPQSLRNLSFGNHFNQMVNNLPQTLKKIKFDYLFNCTVDNLPQTLESLTVGTSFNQTINNLPQSLKKLSLGNNFNQNLDNLPNSIN